MIHPKLIQLTQKNRFLSSYEHENNIYFTVVPNESEVYISNCRFKFKNNQQYQLLYSGSIDNIPFSIILKFFIKYINQDGYWILNGNQEEVCYDVNEDDIQIVIKNLYKNLLNSNSCFIYSL